MVSAVAPQTPLRLRFSSGVSGPLPLGNGTRHGPIEQTLQQLPTSPMGQGLIANARSNDRFTPSHDAFSIICSDA